MEVLLTLQTVTQIVMAVVLATSQYKDGSGDFTVLVKGCCTKITTMI
jgi:hypothetical protein